MELVSRQEAREYRIELALEDIENAASAALFRPEVSRRCLIEIGHRVKQLRADLRRPGPALDLAPDDGAEMRYGS